MAREERLSVESTAPVKPPILQSGGGFDLDLTPEKLRELARTDPDKALRLLELRERLQRHEQQVEHEIRLSKEQQQKLEAIDKQIQATYEAQLDCLHRKENGQPALGGIRDSQNNTHYVCLRCEKTWINGELPAHLRTGLRDIGGPSYS